MAGKFGAGYEASHNSAMNKRIAIETAMVMVLVLAIFALGYIAGRHHEAISAKAWGMPPGAMLPDDTVWHGQRARATAEL